VAEAMVQALTVAGNPAGAMMPQVSERGVGTLE